MPGVGKRGNYEQDGKSDSNATGHDDLLAAARV
jgi:hypothetical protein